MRVKMHAMDGCMVCKERLAVTVLTCMLQVQVLKVVHQDGRVCLRPE
jgi:hypothetical protein